jgi:hypothetical protein
MLDLWAANYLLLVECRCPSDNIAPELVLAGPSFSYMYQSGSYFPSVLRLPSGNGLNGRYYWHSLYVQGRLQIQLRLSVRWMA